MFIFQIDAANIKGPENKKGISQTAKDPDSILLNSLSQDSELNQVESTEGIHRPPPNWLLRKIIKLSKDLLEDPYNHLTEVPELGKALAKYTNTEYDLGKGDSLISFFLRDKSDLTGDGQIDYQDVIKFWENLDHSEKPPFPMHVSIDLDNDGTNDYFINNGKIFALHDGKQEEVDSIPGVDLQKLSDEIKQKFEECKNNPPNPNEKPFPCVGVQFDDDINGDGKIDHIVADTGIRTPVLMTPQEQINQRPMELD